MSDDGTAFTLADVARRLDVPQHRLIHLCEKRVVVPDVKDADGRGSSRVFSELNLLELAVALRLRDMLLPVSAIRGLVHVLRTFSTTLPRLSKNLTVVQHLREPDSPDLRIVLSDGELVFFTLAGTSGAPRVFGGVPLAELVANEGVQNASLKAARPPSSGSPDHARFGGPEGSHFARMELSVNAIARALPIN